MISQRDPEPGTKGEHLFIYSNALIKQIALFWVPKSRETDIYIYIEREGIFSSEGRPKLNYEHIK